MAIKNMINKHDGSFIIDALSAASFYAPIKENIEPTSFITSDGNRKLVEKIFNGLSSETGIVIFKNSQIGNEIPIEAYKELVSVLGTSMIIDKNTVVYITTDDMLPRIYECIDSLVSYGLKLVYDETGHYDNENADIASDEIEYGFSMNGNEYNGLAYVLIDREAPKNDFYHNNQELIDSLISIRKDNRDILDWFGMYNETDFSKGIDHLTYGRIKRPLPNIIFTSMILAEGASNESRRKRVIKYSKLNTAISQDESNTMICIYSKCFEILNIWMNALQENNIILNKQDDACYEKLSHFGKMIGMDVQVETILKNAPDAEFDSFEDCPSILF